MYECCNIIQTKFLKFLYLSTEIWSTFYFKTVKSINWVFRLLMNSGIDADWAIWYQLNMELWVTDISSVITHFTFKYFYCLLNLFGEDIWNLSTTIWCKTTAYEPNFAHTITEDQVSALSLTRFILLCELAYQLVIDNSYSDMAISASNLIKASLTQVTLIFLLGNNLWFEQVWN